MSSFEAVRKKLRKWFRIPNRLSPGLKGCRTLTGVMATSRVRLAAKGSLFLLAFTETTWRATPRKLAQG